MRRIVVVMAIAGFVGLASGPPAHAWMIAQDCEQELATDQNNVEWWFDSHVRTIGGGKDTASNAFEGPNIQYDTFLGPPNPHPAVPYTIARFLGIGSTGLKATIPQSPGGKRNFGVFGEGPLVPRMIDVQWKVDGAVSASVPIPSVAFTWVAFDNTTGLGTVQVTVTNETYTDDIVVSEVGYRVLPINSFSLANLNRGTPGTRAGMPPSTFAPSGVADGTVLTQGAANSAAFLVGGVGLSDDIVVYVTSRFNSLGGAPSGTWVAWNSGTYVPARKPYLGRVMLPAVNSSAGVRNASAYTTALGYIENAAHTELMNKIPFRAITPVAGTAPARFFSMTRSNVHPGRVALEASKNAGYNDLLLCTTGPGGMKRGYLRTAAECVYRDVLVKARVLPGASSNSTLATRMTINSDDFGGPVAIRVTPTGDSYYASVLTRRPTEISLMKELGGVKTVLTTTGAGAAWDNGDPILIDRVDPVPMPAPPNAYVPTTYDVALSAIGNVITLKVTEVGNPLHTKTLSAIDGSIRRGYVGLRVERDGGLESPTDTNGALSVKYETMIQNYEIEDPLASYAYTVAVGSSMAADLDALEADGGTLQNQRSASVLSDAEIAQMFYAIGIRGSLLQTTWDLDNYVERGGYADGCTNPAGCTWPAGGPAAYNWAPMVVPFGQTLPFFEPPFDSGSLSAYWQSGTSAGGTTHNGSAFVNIPQVLGEHVLGQARSCQNLGAIVNRNAADVGCAGAGATWFDARAGLYAANSGDFRGGAGPNPWGGNLYFHPDSIRILSAAQGGDPTHPIVAGLSDGTGTQLTKVYAFPWRHFMTGGDPVTAGALPLAVETQAALAGGADGVVNGHPAWGIVTAEAGTGRIVVAPDANAPNPTFPARNAFIFPGDHSFHRMTYVGFEIARRTILWSLGAPIQPSPWIYFGDADEDGDVDLNDFSHFSTCFNGPNNPIDYAAGCLDVDSDQDGDVDLLDFSAFASCFNGPNRAPGVGCQVPPISIPGAL